MRAALLISLSLVVSTAFGGVREREYSSADGLFVRRPPVDYPLEARRAHQTGEGRVRLYVDTSGRITATKVLQSTGHPLLDAAAVRMFMSARAVAGPRREIDMPVSFQITPGRQPPPPSQHPHPIIVREFTN